ncbi:MAG: hypothetical protein JKY34_10665 [Kordiimonadaceae bacterium]|nr:hypothetical protein [Kordiimonadaceae bacterium]
MKDDFAHFLRGPCKKNPLCWRFDYKHLKTEELNTVYTLIEVHENNKAKPIGKGHATKAA